MSYKTPTTMLWKGVDLTEAPTVLNYAVLDSSLFQSYFYS
jgi:hypothetical protein